MTLQEQITAKVAIAQAAKDEQNQAALTALIDNENFIEIQRSLNAKTVELRKLTTIMKQLNAIQPFTANDGTVYKINAYPINAFGNGLGHILGIIAASRSAFTDEFMLQYEAITGLDMLEVSEAVNALGQPAYFTKDGELKDAISGNVTELNELLNSITAKLGIFEFDTQLTTSAYDNYFTKAENAALKKQLAFSKNAGLTLESFTMED